jgi:Ser/Thr protein kinase RdoA (MazF antagonist)
VNSQPDSTTVADFEHLVPDAMLGIVEETLGKRLSGVAVPLPSYINRVYEVAAMDGERYVAKFYRPGRWSPEALRDEHDYVADCAGDEIPVIAPLRLNGGDSLHEADGVYFTVFPKRYGRQLEITSVKHWVRVGRLLGRVHVVGSRREAPARTDLHPGASTATHLAHLVDGGFITSRHAGAFREVTGQILEEITPLFEDTEFIRIHGDCHCGNLLYRPGEGLMLIDFDDMMMGPPVQDMWLLLPDRVDRCRQELDLLLHGYEQFREFDDTTLRLVEPLRAMRIIYFLAWCSHQVDDYRFRHTYPDWGSDGFWQREIADLTRQLEAIRQTAAYGGMPS